VTTKSASLTGLDSQEDSMPPPESGSPTHLPNPRPLWREVAEDTVAAAAVSSAIVLLAYLYGST